MFLIPLTQIESVELVVHALKMAAGDADCTGCPAYRVCMKQCRSIAGAIEGMIEREELPRVGDLSSVERELPKPQSDPEDDPPTGGPSPRTGRLRVIK